MAALQAKLDQSERETSRLNKALERSDTYIEELEDQILQLRGIVKEKENGSPADEASFSINIEENKGSSEESLTWTEQEQSKEERIITMRRSLSQMEQPSVGKLQDDDFMYSGIAHHHQSEDISESNYNMKNNLFPGHHKLLLATASVNDTSLLQVEKKQIDKASVHKDGKNIQLRLPSPNTPSTSLSYLQLNSPNGTDIPAENRKNVRKPQVYLRKLTFDEFGCSGIGNKISSGKNADLCASTETLSGFTSKKPEFWNTCQNELFDNSDYETSEQSPRSKNKLPLSLSETLQAINDSEVNRTRTSSEASMEAAYFDKICELDCMISESENSRSPNFAMKLIGPDSTTPSEQTQKSELTNKAAKKLEYRLKPGHHTDESCSQSSSLTLNSSEGDPVSLSVSSSFMSEMNESILLSGDPKPDASVFHSDDSFSCIQVNSSEMVFKDKMSTSPSFMSAKDQNVLGQCHTPWATTLIPENKKMFGSARNSCPSAKRKNPCCLGTASPSKASKMDK